MITWGYTFFIQNNSTYPAFKIRFHLNDEYANLQFPSMKKVKPMAIFSMEEMHLQSVERLHKDEPVKSLEKVGFEAKYQKKYFVTRDTARKLAESFFPDSIANMEILIEYFNEDGESFFTKFTRTDSDKWENQLYGYKPFEYTKIGKKVIDIWKTMPWNKNLTKK